MFSSVLILGLVVGFLLLVLSLLLGFIGSGSVFSSLLFLRPSVFLWGFQVCRVHVGDIFVLRHRRVAA